MRLAPAIEAGTQATRTSLPPTPINPARSADAWRGVMEICDAGERIALAEVAIEQAWRAAELSSLRELIGADASSVSALRVQKKQRDRLAGRLAARLATAQLSGRLPERIAVRQGGIESGQPYVVIGGRELGLSISHAGDTAVAAAADCGIGIDVELRVARSNELIALSFTDAELNALARARRVWSLSASDAINLLWCTKEAALKWLGIGLRAPLLGVEVIFDAAAPRPVTASTATAGSFAGLRVGRLDVRLDRELADELALAARHPCRVLATSGPTHVVAIVH